MDRIESLLLSKGGIVLAFALVFLVLERVFPAARNLIVHGVSRLVRNISLFAINAVLSPLFVIPLSAFAAQWALDWRAEWWAGWPGLAADLLLLDLWIYWWHRANHEVGFLWRFHEVHHLDEFLDVTSAIRFHFGEVFLSSLVRAVVIFLLDIPLTSIVVFEALILIGAIFHHSNVRIPAVFEKGLSKIVVTPSIHWVHHHALRRDTDSNYSTLLSFWDLIFFTRSPTQRTADMTIGVEKRFDQNLPALLARPFRTNRELP